MTNQEKRELVFLCKKGYLFSEIRKLVNCSDVTIKRYMKIFTSNQAENKDAENCGLPENNEVIR